MRPETVLGFDTSAAHCAAALLLPDGRVIQRQEAMDKGQAERLMPLLEELLAEAGLVWGDLTALGVGTGPGNFTGVRISVAAARGLALGLAIPAHGVTRLEALAHGLPRPVLVAEDARRGEAYVQGFGISAQAEPHLALVAELPSLPPGTHLTGSAFAAALPPAMPIAEAIARIAATRPPTPQRPAPFYLRSADAAPPADPPPVILP
ncbi:tRNA (adenosine(37)-N6)-threonylcarbamoyltransferase complex dimerization subunit type 1 TsaB [Gemmobacter fulvus]|uniref:tRNA (Adenosine(37)-N6)-threonylcarbamoyltransferase complex dimerization subunit type 1 TsaB n=1 Tax=Gemmobacter fulvus TaxID=2840474 RepID=A0A975P8N6_9RHOB|nr:tRNA (adenosine(37)-N6)-threonylcarbamoyltransferase complex dimerization subunit type 1 TsaB [Gemmobacter fulvus]MBT9244129.1 tRNA (adenosine(37)-N6)-threonylcarbamoyltransferase complex dimerization subunit type 1 TsaB [Gemmobacter fulvus]QWK91033.1 tRNA (adenosine(37)-N6)-threonylcarbamoyltransferase complex dimerization subunit type 1 TsaB [Gemmobacter fulvus]